MGNPETNPDRYSELSPFRTADTAAGNERWLQHLALRLYCDTDIEYQLSTRRNSYYDTDLPDASELIDRLMLAGDKRAEFIAAKHPAFRTNEPDDAETYTGTIDMLDYQALVPFRLNIMAHIRNCPGQRHTALFIEASPKPFTDPLWQELKAPKTHFACEE